MAKSIRNLLRPPGLSKRRFLLSLYATELILVLLSLLAARLFYDNYLPYEFEFGPGSIVLGLAAAIPIGLVVYLMSYGPLSRLGWIKRAMSNIVDRMYTPFGQSIQSLSVFDIVLLSCAAGIGEELFFRGLIQSFAGVWWTAIIFGLLHALTPAYFLIATAIGTWFGLLYQFSDNLLVPILGHAAYDVFALLLLRSQFAQR